MSLESFVDKLAEHFIDTAVEESEKFGVVYELLRPLLRSHILYYDKGRGISCPTSLCGDYNVRLYMPVAHAQTFFTALERKLDNYARLVEHNRHVSRRYQKATMDTEQAREFAEIAFYESFPNPPVKAAYIDVISSGIRNEPLSVIHKRAVDLMRLKFGHYSSERDLRTTA